MTDPKMTGTKTCSKCEKDLPVICFSVNRSHKDGLHNACRECRVKANKKYYVEVKQKRKSHYDREFL